MDLLAPDFDVVRGRAAYDVARVDEAVAETRRLLAGQPTSPTSGAGGFDLTREEGYDAGQVDAWRDAVRRRLASLAQERYAEDDPPELRDVPRHDSYDGTPATSSFPAWVRITALVLAVTVALFFVASYFV